MFLLIVTRAATIDRLVFNYQRNRQLFWLKGE